MEEAMLRRRAPNYGQRNKNKACAGADTFTDFEHAVATKSLSVLMADNGDVLFSPEQEEWIKELVSSLQRQRDPSPPATNTVGTSSGIGSSSDNTSTAGNLRELAIP